MQLYSDMGFLDKWGSIMPYMKSSYNVINSLIFVRVIVESYRMKGQ